MRTGQLPETAPELELSYLFPVSICAGSCRLTHGLRASPGRSLLGMLHPEANGDKFGQIHEELYSKADRQEARTDGRTEGRRARRLVSWQFVRQRQPLTDSA